MTRPLLWRVALSLLLLTLARPAGATTQTGQILVTVRGVPEQPLAGVEVEVSGSELIGGPRRNALSEDGTVRFIQLPPGSYAIEVVAPRYRSTKVDQLKVRIGYTTPVEVQLESAPEEAMEEIRVVSTRQVVDLERVALGASISAETLENLPISRSYQSVTLLLPGVYDTGFDGNPNVLGGTDYGNQYLLDGINITDPFTNTFSANFNFDAMAEVEVIAGGRDAEYGSAVGGVVNIVTRSGGNQFTADGSIYWEPDALQLKTKADKGLTNSSLTLNLNLGGPVLRDKLWYFVSAEVPWTQSTIPHPESGNPFPGTGKHPTRDFKGVYALGKLTWAASDDHTVKLLIQADPARIQNDSQDPFTHPDAERVQTQTGFRVALSSEYFITDQLLLNSRLAYSQNSIGALPMSDDYDTPSRFNRDTGLTTDNSSSWYDDTRQRIQGHASLAYTLDGLLGEHQLKGGVDFALTRHSVFDSIPGGAIYTDALDPADPLGGLPYQVERLVEPQDTVIWGDTEGVFVQDIWRPLDSLTIRPGVRYDSARMRNWEGETQVVLNTISPRVGAVWDPFGDGKTAVRGGYYQYIDTGYLLLSDFAGGNSKLTRVYEYNPITEQYDQFVYENGGPSSVVAKPYLKKAWDQRRPRTHEFLFGVGREIITDLGVSADFTYRFSGNQWEDTEENVIWNEAGDQVLGFRDGQARYVYSLGALKEAFIRYYGLQLQVTKAFSYAWEMTASYTWSKLEGTEPSIISIAFDRPAMRDYEYGYLPGDVRHMVKLDSSYVLPWGIVVGGTFRLYSGEPYDRYFFNSFYADYGDRRAPRGFDVDGSELRLPWRYSLNVRAKWDMEELIGQRLELIVEGYNLTNRRTVYQVEERDLGDGTFGDATGKLSPLNVLLGLRFRY